MEFSAFGFVFFDCPGAFVKPMVTVLFWHQPQQKAARGTLISVAGKPWSVPYPQDAVSNLCLLGEQTFSPDITEVTLFCPFCIRDTRGVPDNKGMLGTNENPQQYLFVQRGTTTMSSVEVS